MTPRPARSLAPYEALLHEDLVVPVHAHRREDDHLVALLPDGPRAVTPEQAGDLVRTLRPTTDPADLGIDLGTDLGTDPGMQVADGSRGVRRRAVLGGAAAGFGALLAASARPRYSFAATTTPRDLLVVVFLRGGFDGLSAVVPVGDPAYYAARPRTAVPASATTPLEKGYGLHTAMSALRPAWDAGELAVVPHVGHPWITRSHFDDQVAAERCALPTQRSGWVARHLQTSSATSGTFRAISIGGRVTTSLTTTAFEALAMRSVDDFDLWGWNGDGSRDLQRSIMQSWYATTGGAMADQAATTFAAIDGLAKVRSTAYVPAGGAAYPDTDLGRGMREIARLAKAGVGMEAAAIDAGDFDHHVDLVTGAPGLAGRFTDTAGDLARSLAALRTDLGDRWATTTVVTVSEFGRRVAENGDRGLDHGNATTMLLLGGGIRGGVHGPSASLASGLTMGAVPVLTDYRQPLSEVVAGRLANGANLATVFPGFVPGTPLGVVR